MDVRLSRKVSSALILGLVLGCPLAGGCVDWRAELAAAVLAGLALLFAAERPGHLSLLAGASIGVSALIALQLIPLPSSLLRILSPSTAEMLEGTLKPIGLYPSARPLSLDPAATARELGKSLACACVILAATSIASSQRGRTRIVSGLAIAGLLVSVLGLCDAFVHAGTGLETKLPFGNPNHLAGFLNLTAWPALGLGLESKGNRRVAWMVCFAITGSGVFLSLSRGGIGAFVAGFCIFALLHLFYARRQSERLGWGILGIVTPMLGAVVIASFLGHDRVIQEMQTVSFGHLSTIDKIAIWPVLTRLIQRFPLAGVGRGAFATTFPAFKVAADPFTWTHAENEWLQAFVDLGIPGGLLLIGAFAWTWFKAAARPLSASKLAIVAGTAAVALHNVVDFSLEILGVAVPFAVSLALLAEPGRGFFLRRKALRAFAVLGGTLATIGVLVHHVHSAEVDGARVASARTSEEARVLAQAAVAWHPSDYFPQEAAGVQLVYGGRCTEGLPWLFRAMALNPSSPNSHFFAAKCLALGRRDVLAKREYRLAFLFGRQDALADALQRYPDLEDMLQIAPESADGLVVLGALLADHQRFLEAKAIFERAWNEYGDNVALARLGDVALALNEPELALSWSRKLREREPQWSSAYIVSADALLKLGQSEAAREELTVGASAQPGNPDVLLRLSELLITQRKFAQARKALLSAQPRIGQESSRLHRSIADTLKAEDRTSEAIAEMEAALDADPQDRELLLQLANMLAESGRYTQAIAVLQRVAGAPNDVQKKIDAQISELESKQRSERSRLLLENSKSTDPTVQAEGNRWQ